MKRKIVGAITGLALLFGITMISAPAANAVTTSWCYDSYYNGYTYSTCYYDYNWYEEIFYGYRDGWYTYPVFYI